MRRRSTRVCCIDGCSRSVVSFGYCGAHAKRIEKYGDPLADKPVKSATAAGEATAWLKAHVDFCGAECLFWPFSKGKGGYGQIASGRGSKGAHREMCRLARGEPPTPAHQTAHSCGNGHGGCVNPMHLSWKTARGNAEDRILHGRQPRGMSGAGAKLTDDAVKFIRLSIDTNADLAKRFGVSRQTVAKARSGQTWAHLSTHFADPT